MTYSQPTTSSVSISSRTGSGPGGRAIKLPSSTPMSPNGAYLDNRDPDRAYNSRIKETEALTGFIKKLVEGPGQWPHQAGHRRSSPMPRKLLARSSMTQTSMMSRSRQDRYRQLSPMPSLCMRQRRQRLLRTSVPGALNAGVTLRPLLQQDSADNPELQAEQGNCLEAGSGRGSEASGLAAVSPGLRLQYNQQVQQTNAIVSGTFRQNGGEGLHQQAEVNRLQRLGFSDQMGTKLAGMRQLESSLRR